jgi:hypothetical protein
MLRIILRKTIYLYSKVTLEKNIKWHVSEPTHVHDEQFSWCYPPIVLRKHVSLVFQSHGVRMTPFVDVKDPGSE